MIRKTYDRMFTDGRKLYLFRLMQALLLGAFLIGLAKQNLGIIVNSGIAFGITFLPAYLEDDHNIPMGPGITLWITLAVLLHAVGTLGPYKSTAWWDSMTHLLSAAIVSGVGYAVTRALDAHDEEINLPSKFLFLFILLFAMAFGVVWELLEFLISEFAGLMGATSVLTQYGLADTMKDLMFDMAGAVAFAVLGTPHVQHVITALHQTLETREQHRHTDTDG